MISIFIILVFIIFYFSILTENVYVYQDQAKKSNDIPSRRTVRIIFVNKAKISDINVDGAISNEFNR